VLDAIRTHRLVLVGSRTYFSELHRTLTRPRIARRYGVTARRRHRLITRLYTLAQHVEPPGGLALCRDPDDDYLIEMALLSRAELLLTEDDDLHDDPAIVELLRRHGTELLRAGSFARRATAPG
jgi:putative PIN family toxin of toxin-antitoxin system